MKHKLVTPVTITPTSFDLAVIEVVEVLFHRSESLPGYADRSLLKKEILQYLGIQYSVWPLMVNHHRHVSKQRVKQMDIVKRLRDHFWVNPDFIWHYPANKEMFVVSGLLMASEPTAPYGAPLPGSAKLLKAEVQNLRKELTLREAEIVSLRSERDTLTEDLTNARLLIRQLNGNVDPPAKTVKE